MIIPKFEGYMREGDIPEAISGEVGKYNSIRETIGKAPVGEFAEFLCGDLKQAKLLRAALGVKKIYEVHLRGMVVYARKRVAVKKK